TFERTSRTRQMPFNKRERSKMQFRIKLTCAAAALTIGMAPVAARALELTLFHTWSNESEMDALNTVIKAFEAKTGKTVKAASVRHESAGESGLASLIVAGTPPNLFLAAHAGFYRDLRDKGLGQEVGTLFDKIGATKAIPEPVMKAITIDGEVRKIPV